MCFTSSKSSSNTSQSADQFDERIAAADGGIAIRIDDGSTINLTDPGIIEAVSGALMSFEEVNKAALSFAEGANEQATDLTREILDRARTEGAQAVEQVLKIGAVVAVIAIIATQGHRFIKARG